MSATYKMIFSKPSLSDVWFFESDISIPFSNLNNPNGEILGLSNHNVKLTDYPGAIKIEILENISVEELESRREELKEIRPDLYDALFQSTIVDYTDLTNGTLIELIKKHNTPIPFNPFTTTITEVVEFGTWEDFVNLYSKITPESINHCNNVKDRSIQFNNTIVEEFYIDGVKQDYAGRLSTS